MMLCAVLFIYASGVLSVDIKLLLLISSEFRCNLICSFCYDHHLVTTNNLKVNGSVNMCFMLWMMEATIEGNNAMYFLVVVYIFNVVC